MVPARLLKKIGRVVVAQDLHVDVLQWRFRIQQKAADVAQAASLAQHVQRVAVTAQHLAVLNADALAAVQQVSGAHLEGVA